MGIEDFDEDVRERVEDFKKRFEEYCAARKYVRIQIGETIVVFLPLVLRSLDLPVLGMTEAVAGVFLTYDRIRLIPKALPLYGLTAVVDDVREDELPLPEAKLELSDEMLSKIVADYLDKP